LSVVLHGSRRDMLVGADADVIDPDDLGHLLEALDIFVEAREEMPDADRTAGLGNRPCMIGGDLPPLQRRWPHRPRAGQSCMRQQQWFRRDFDCPLHHVLGRVRDVADKAEPVTGVDHHFQGRNLRLPVYRRCDADTGGWVTDTDEQAHYAPARWVQRQVEETGGPVMLRASSMLMHLEAIRAGTGRGVLPCYVGDGHPLLERLTPPIPEIAAEYWIIVHRDLRRSACVRAVIDWVKALFAEQRDLIAGAV
jgi:DNA-binding transcriptional LysR family regulator